MVEIESEGLYIVEYDSQNAQYLQWEILTDPK
jgi:hypothetical protein